MLGNQQKVHFDAFGFLILREAFSAEEMESITAEAEASWQQNLANQNEAEGYQAVVPFVERSPHLAELPVDDRIWQPIEELLGAGFVWGRSEGNKGTFNETLDHQWHSDRAGEIDGGHRDVYELLMQTTPPKYKLQIACMLADRELAMSLLASHPKLVDEFDEEDLTLLGQGLLGNQQRYRGYTSHARLRLSGGYTGAQSRVLATA